MLTYSLSPRLLTILNIAAGGKYKWHFPLHLPVHAYWFLVTTTATIVNNAACKYRWCYISKFNVPCHHGYNCALSFLWTMQGNVSINDIAFPIACTLTWFTPRHHGYCSTLQCVSINSMHLNMPAYALLPWALSWTMKIVSNNDVICPIAPYHAYFSLPPLILLWTMQDCKCPWCGI